MENVDDIVEGHWRENETNGGDSVAQEIAEGAYSPPTAIEGTVTLVSAPSFLPIFFRLSLFISGNIINRKREGRIKSE